MCRRLRAIINKYDRWTIDFQRIAKPDFHLFCRYVNPENIISLTLSDDHDTSGQIEIFLSLFTTHQFTRLQSVTLIKVSAYALEAIFRTFKTTSLKSFSFTVEKHKTLHKETMRMKVLSMIITETNLVKLELLEFQWHELEKMIWPKQSSIQHLKIQAPITPVEICTILICLSHLRTLVIGELYDGFNAQNSLPYMSTPFRQVISLAIEKMTLDIDDLELFLSLLPSLTHMKLMIYEKFVDGNRLKNFIQTNLPLLNNVEFFLCITRYVLHGLADIQSLITSYRTPFWFEQNKWCVTCEYSSDAVKLYPIPFCNEITNHRLCRKVKKLDINFKDNLPSNWILTVSTLVDLSTIVQIKFTGQTVYKTRRDIRASIANFLQRTSSLISLGISYDSYMYNFWTADNICCMIPSHVKHLTTSIKHVNEMKLVLKRLPQLSSITFHFHCPSNIDAIFGWLAKYREGSKCKREKPSISIWLGKGIIQSIEYEHVNKKIKLSDNHHDAFAK
ncbi:unnamed protein product [Adineta steineri]|uniref:Uncharacterized protein n=1 Tax=Adineta steineri TaxID=433720 RepID=A0A819VRW9_9BILA|nr:unnamed protein product [Adineta steineri]CAF4114334.1 unnamed protein product [Adineta steineri]